MAANCHRFLGIILQGGQPSLAHLRAWEEMTGADDAKIAAFAYGSVFAQPVLLEHLLCFMNHEAFDIPAYLATLPLFVDMSHAERENMAIGCSLKQWSAGETAFRAGDPCDAFHVVISGQVRLYVASATGQEKVIELIGPGQSFAEAFVFLNRPYVVSAQVLTDTLLLNVSKQVVLAELAREPSFSLHMLAGISKRLHCLIQDVEGYALQNGMQRLIGYLLREAEACGCAGQKTIVVNLPASKATIASRLSLTPEYFSRVLHELESQSLIEINHRDIRILDIQRLAQFGSH